ncbi:MAG TPA: LysR family transcriptional regulator [Psychromonas sp.]
MGFNGKLLDGLVIFAEVIKAGSFTNAAASSGHSTSYISKEISKLETRLGVRLLNRTTRSISLTAEGELYYQQCVQLINEVQQFEDDLSGRQKEPQGVLKISVPLGFALARIRPVLSDFMALYPKIGVNIELNDLKVDLIAEGFDLAIRATNQLPDSSLICKRFMSCGFVVVASPQYLKENGNPRDPGELVDHKTISYSYIKNPTQWVFRKAAQKEIVVTVNSQVITNSGEMQLALCLAGQGITRLPDFYINDELENGQLVQLFDEYNDQNINIYLVYPSRKHMSAKVRCFIRFIEERLGNQA